MSRGSRARNRRRKQIVREQRRIIVKVQRSIASGDGPRLLVYNRDRSIQFEGPLDEEVAAYMGDELKVFSFALVAADGKVALDGHAPW